MNIIKKFNEEFYPYGQIKIIDTKKLEQKLQKNPNKYLKEDNDGNITLDIKKIIMLVDSCCKLTPY